MIQSPDSWEKLCPAQLLSARLKQPKLRTDSAYASAPRSITSREERILYINARKHVGSVAWIEPWRTCDSRNLAHICSCIALNVLCHCSLQVLPTFVVGEFVFMLLSLILLIHAIKQVMPMRMRNHGKRRTNGITRLQIPAIPRMSDSPRYTALHTMCDFARPRILLCRWSKEFEWELKNRSHESKLLLALLNKNEFLFDSRSPG